MNLTELSKTIRFHNGEKGFESPEKDLDKKLLLAVSEICEAQEELRDGHGVTEVYYDNPNNLGIEILKNIKTSTHIKPCGFPVEIADCINRLLDICASFNFDVNVNTKGKEISSKGLDHHLLLIVHLIGNTVNYSDIPNTRGFYNRLMESLYSLFSLCNYYEINIMKVIEEKLAFNKTRPPKHGRKF